MHVGKWPAAMPVAKRSEGVAPEEDLRECIYITFASAKQVHKIKKSLISGTVRHYPRIQSYVVQ